MGGGDRHRTGWLGLVARLRRARVLVIGDLILDEFLWGEVSRISPEAPVPVVWQRSHSVMPGGAGNVAQNIAALGGRVSVAGVVGADAEGRTLVALLRAKGVVTGGVVTVTERPSTVKTRVIAHHQQVVRIDREECAPLNARAHARLAACLRRGVDQVDAVILEDYGKGVVTPDLVRSVVRDARRRGIIVAVDPKEDHFPLYKRVDVLTPNRMEAEGATGIRILDDRSLRRAGATLLRQLQCRAVLITLGEGGMQLFERSGAVTHIPTAAQEVFDVSGAGDTVVAVLTMALAAGVAMRDAAALANAAAGVVVGKVGIAVASPDELAAAVANGRVAVGSSRARWRRSS